MASDRMTVRRALYDAIDWQTSLADAYHEGDHERAEALALAERYRAVLKRRYGHTKTPMEGMADNCVSVTLDEVRSRSEEAPDNGNA